MANEKRLIEATALIDTIEGIDWHHFNLLGKLVGGANPANNTPVYKAEDIYRAINNAPTVDAVEVVHGLWKSHTSASVECSACGGVVLMRFKFCPNCGAKMDGDGNG